MDQPGACVIHYVSADPPWVSTVVWIVLALDFLMIGINIGYLYKTRKVFVERWWFLG